MGPVLNKKFILFGLAFITVAFLTVFAALKSQNLALGNDIKVVSEFPGYDIKLANEKVFRDYLGEIGFWEQSGVNVSKGGAFDLITVRKLVIHFTSQEQEYDKTSDGFGRVFRSFGFSSDGVTLHLYAHVSPDSFSPDNRQERVSTNLNIQILRGIYFLTLHQGVGDRERQEAITLESEYISDDRLFIEIIKTSSLRDQNPFSLLLHFDLVKPVYAQCGTADIGFNSCRRQCNNGDSCDFVGQRCNDGSTCEERCTCEGASPRQCNVVGGSCSVGLVPTECEVSGCSGSPAPSCSSSNCFNRCCGGNVCAGVCSGDNCTTGGVVQTCSNGCSAGKCNPPPSGGGSTCSGGDGCKSGCNPPDPDCGSSYGSPYGTPSGGYGSPYGTPQPDRCGWCTPPHQCRASGCNPTGSRGWCSSGNDQECCCPYGGPYGSPYGYPYPYPSPYSYPTPLRSCSRTVCSNERCVSQSYRATSCGLSSQCSSDINCCINRAPRAPSLRDPRNGSTQVLSTVTLSWNHNGDFGKNCSGNNNRFFVYLEAGDTTPDQLVCDVPGGTTSCNASISDRQTYYWKVGASNGITISDSSTWAFNALFHSGGWFQVQDTDLANPGDLISQIPGQCSPPQCTPQFNLGGGGGYPGVPAYGGSSASFGEGSVSGEGWLANTAYAGRRFNYAFFARNIPSDATQITSSSVSGGDLNSMAASDKVAFAVREGDLVITSTANFSNKKLVLFVTGNLTIKDRITLNDGRGFFAAIVGGSINIHPQVSHPNNPALEGLFLADGTINTGTQKPAADNRLYVRGALVGWGGVNLERDLDPSRSSGANNDTPAEFVEYAPDLILTFPRELLREGLVWREVAP